MKRKFDYLSVIKCEGATCISLNENIKKYYASGITHRNLKAKVYRYENN